MREDFFALASVSGLLLRSLEAGSGYATRDSVNHECEIMNAVVDNQGQTALTGDILTVSIQ